MCSEDRQTIDHLQSFDYQYVMNVKFVQRVFVAIFIISGWSLTVAGQGNNRIIEIHKDYNGVNFLEFARKDG